MAWSLGGALSSASDWLGLSSQQNTQALSTMTPEQQQYYTQLLQGIQGNQQNPYQVSQAPDISQFNYNPSWQGQSDEAMASMLSGKPAYEINPEATEQYYKESIYNPAVKQYEETTRPAWMEKTSNIHSSQRDIQEQQGYEDLYGGLSAQHGQLAYADEQARRQSLESAAARQGQGIGLGQQAQQLAQSQWGTENQLAQNQWQAQNQLGLSANQSNYQQQLAQYQAMLQALGLTGQENLTTQQSGGLTNILGGLGAGASIYAALSGSDRRLKENIDKIDEIDNINIYKFNFKGNKIKQIGVIAQEIKKDYPECVIKNKDGYYMVRYDLLPVKVNQRIGELRWQL